MQPGTASWGYRACFHIKLTEGKQLLLIRTNLSLASPPVSDHVWADDVFCVFVSLFSSGGGLCGCFLCMHLRNVDIDEGAERLIFTVLLLKFPGLDSKAHPFWKPGDSRCTGTLDDAQPHAFTPAWSHAFYTHAAASVFLTCACAFRQSGQRMEGFPLRPRCRRVCALEGEDHLPGLAKPTTTCRCWGIYPGTRHKYMYMSRACGLCSLCLGWK